MNRDFLKMENFRRLFGNPNYQFININNISGVTIGYISINIHTTGFIYFSFPKTKYNLELLEKAGFDLE